MHYIDEACWKGYQQYGMKTKNGKQVPNCVPIQEAEDYCAACLVEELKRCSETEEYITLMEPSLNEAEYRGRKVKLGKPFLTPGGPRKRSVYVKNAKGNVVKVNFGDPNMRIRKSNPARRKSFRARHRCENPGPRDRARYWSCRQW